MWQINENNAIRISKCTSVLKKMDGLRVKSTFAPILKI
jgi:hypothetical protein